MPAEPRFFAPPARFRAWIVRRRVDDDAHTIRSTPRLPGSHWSRINIARVEALTSAKREATRECRLAKLIEDCAADRRIGPLAAKDAH